MSARLPGTAQEGGGHEVFEEHRQVPTALAWQGLNVCSRERRCSEKQAALHQLWPCSYVAAWSESHGVGHVAMWSGDQTGWMATWLGRHAARARSAGAGQECSQGRCRGFVSLWCEGAMGDWVPCPSLHVGGELQREGWWGAPGSAHLGPQAPQSGPTWEPLYLASLCRPGLSSGLLLFGSPHGASPGRGCHRLLCRLCIPAATTLLLASVSHVRALSTQPACRPTGAAPGAAGTTCPKQHAQRPDRWRERTDRAAGLGPGALPIQICPPDLIFRDR